MKTASIRALLTTIFTLGLLSGGGRLRAQNISEIAKSDPLIISGAIGTQNTYRYSSVGDGHSSPFSSAIYANLNFSIYGFNMPFSLYFTSDNITHAWTLDDGSEVYLHKFVGSMPSMTKNRSAVYEADVLSGRKRESVSFNGTVKSTITAWGSLIHDGAHEDYSSIEDFEELELW